MNRYFALMLTTTAVLARTALASEAAPAPASPQPALPTVVIEGVVEKNEVRSDRVDSIGPLGTTPLLDTPYSIAVLPEKIIEDSQAVNFKDVSKYLPLVSYQEQQGPDILRPQTRGMQGGNFQNSKLDGMTIFVTGALAMEQFKQIEVVNGLSASLYGPANPAGMFNFVSKRPVDGQLNEIDLRYASDSIGTVHADLSGKIDSAGIVRYRLNGLFGEGSGYVEGSHQRRILGDLGIDIRPWEKGIFELNYSDYSLINTGFPGWFTYGQAIQLPSAPNPEWVGYGQEFAGIKLRTRIASIRLKQEINANWRFVIGGLNQDALRNINTPVNNLTTNGGDYTSSYANGFAPRFVITSETAYLNGNFTTWGFAHDLTVGTAGYKSQTYAVITPATAASVRLGTANINSPVQYPAPAAGAPDPWLNFNSSNVYQQGINLNDAIELTEQWTVRGGISQDWFHTNNYNAAATQLAGYKDQGISPSGSLIFKPVPSSTVYFTYASSLQSGDNAPGTAANGGQSLAPYRSKEYELGYKQRIGTFDLTAALYRVERPFANIDPTDNVFKITGDQVNRGIELSAIGEIFSGLTVYSGAQIIDAKMEHTALATTNDQIYVGTPKIKGNALFEYQIAPVPGLTAIVNYQFAGPRPANDTNTVSAAGYNLFDLGVKYTSRLFGKPLTSRLTVNNVADRQYWSTIGPSNLTGANTGNLLAHLGSPRTVLATVSIEL